MWCGVQERDCLDSCPFFELHHQVKGWYMGLCAHLLQLRLRKRRYTSENRDMDTDALVQGIVRSQTPHDMSEELQETFVQETLA